MGYEDFSERKNELVELAYYDDAGSYEVNEGGIFLDPVTHKIVFLSASGCSCWDGDYEEDVFDSLLDVEIALLKGGKNGEDLFQYHPSLSACKDLIEEAKRRLPASWVRDSNVAKMKQQLVEVRGIMSTGEWRLFLGEDYATIAEILDRKGA